MANSPTDGNVTTVGPVGTAYTAFDAFDAMANRHRREVLSLLTARDGPVSESALATRLVDRSADEPPHETDRALTELRHVHLPKLASAGLVRRDGDRVSTVPHPVFDRTAFDVLLDPVEHGVDPDELDRVLAALADGHRRTILSVLRTADRLDLSTLAERVAAWEDETLCDGDERRVEQVLAAIHHVHAPTLADAGLVDYDDSTGTLGFEGHPALDEQWLSTSLAES